MTKRTCELQTLVTLIPPCKRPLGSRRCTPDIVHITPVRKRKLDPESGPPAEDIVPSPKCDRVIPADVSSQPPCKKLRVAESPQRPEPQYKCQKDEAFPEYNSFQYWKVPLPDLDFSGLSDQLSGVAANDIQEMDS